MIINFIESYQERASEIKKSFHKIENNWDLANENQELYLQLGHLLNAISKKHNILTRFEFLIEQRRKIDSIPDELADVFLSLFSIASKSEKDLLSCVINIDNDTILHSNIDSMELCICLCILCGQLSESIMLLENKRFNSMDKNEELMKLHNKIGHMGI